MVKSYKNISISVSAHHKTELEHSKTSIALLEEELEMRKGQIKRLREENDHLERLAEAYRSDWLLENRRALLAEQDLPEDCDYWDEVWGSSQSV